MKLRHKAVAAAFGLIALLGTTTAARAAADADAPAPAAATPAATPAADVPKPVAEILGRGTTSAPFKVSSRAPREFVARKVTIPPGAQTGWHYHEGEQIVVQVSGTVERLDENCEVEIHTAGDAYVEPVGARHIHNGINRGTEPVVFYVTDVIPGGAPFSVPAAAPSCAADE
ncbi:cupin domain-containing protein [Streptomyces sp. NPDC035033]|uniref:cupin domain-containing protein n=1 Tax=Streptomyces sp. NPDC035033 TaxID=3155368 RepID=UPI0033D465BA